MGLEFLAGLKGVRTPPGLGSKIAAWKRKKFSTPIQVLGPEGAGVTSYILQLVQPGILDTEVMPYYNEGKTFTSQIQHGGVIRKVQLRDNLVDDEEKRFKSFCADYIGRKPHGVVWIAPGQPDMLKDGDQRPEYDLFRRYVQFLCSDRYPMGGKELKKKKPRFLILLVNHMDEYERLWQVNFFDFLHHYRGPLAYIRKNHRDIRVVTQPCCAWANVGVRDPLMNVLMDLEVEKSG